MADRSLGRTVIAAAPSGAARARRALVQLLDQAVLARIRDGRLRAVDWPRGLGTVVAVGCGLIGLACLLALGSRWLRTGSELTVPAAGGSVPAGLVWLLILMLAVTVALGQAGAMHGPWWLALISTAVCVAIMATFGIHTSLAFGPAVPITVAVLILGVIVFTVVRRRFRFAWWEFLALLVAVGVAMVLGSADFTLRSRQVGGGDLVAATVAGTVSTVMVLSLPAAIAAGTAVAELTVGLTVGAAAQAERLRGRRWPYVLLGVLVAGRLVELAWRLVHLDRVRQGWLALLPGLVIVVVLAGLIGLLLRRARSAPPVVASELPEELGGVALPIGAVMVAGILPLLLFTTVVAVITVLDPTGPLAQTDLDAVLLLSETTDLVRIGIGVVLALLAVRLARRGRAARAVLFGCVGVTLAATGMRSLVGQRWAIWFDPDTVAMLATVVVLGLLVWAVIGRRLTRQRAVAGSALLVLLLLFSLRQYLGDPVGQVVGYSGIGLVVFGLLWDLVTGASWGNGESRRFPRPTRVLLVLTNTALLAVVVAYAALIRDTGRFSVDDFVELGDLVLGVGLLAAAFGVITQAFVRDRTIV